MVDQFILELKLQTFLDHQNVLSLYASFDDKTHVYLVLEYMEEGTLFSHFKKNKTLPEPEVAKKMRQMASAIKYLHENAIAHRDIKPENIVMSHVIIKFIEGCLQTLWFRVVDSLRWSKEDLLRYLWLCPSINSWRSLVRLHSGFMVSGSTDLRLMW